MSTAESWELTPREFGARSNVRDIYMATWRAEIRNAPHFTKKDKTAWNVDDFLMTPEAQARKQQRQKDEFTRARDLSRANAMLSTITKETSDGLPEWAHKKWGAA